jgi:hypothetical protein
VCRGGNKEWHMRNDQVYMGYAMRVQQWRYVVWVHWDSPNFKPLWEKVVSEELYDHRDPRCNEKQNFDLCETVNVAMEQGMRSIKDELFAKLRRLVDSHNPEAWRTGQEKSEREREGKQ